MNRVLLDTSAYSAPFVVTTPQVDPSSCVVRYRVVAQWSGGYQVEVTISCGGTTPVVGWRLTWAMPAGHQISQSWSALISVLGQTVTATNPEWNPVINPGGSATFGFVVVTAATPVVPASFTLNGQPCPIA